jgi:hypothetical protein
MTFNPNANQEGIGWYDLISKGNYTAGIVAEGTVDAGKIANASNLIKVGEAGGKEFVALGIIADGLGVRNYYMKGPNDPNSVSPSKASINTAFGIYGMWDPPVGIMYGFIDLFYPGGWSGYMNDNANRIIQNNDHTPFYYLSSDPLNGYGMGTY